MRMYFNTYSDFYMYRYIYTAFHFLHVYRGCLHALRALQPLFQVAVTDNARSGSTRGGQASMMSISQSPTPVAAACPSSPGTAGLRENNGMVSTSILHCVDCSDDGAKTTGGAMMTESLGVEIQHLLTMFSNDLTLTTRTDVHDPVRT